MEVFFKILNFRTIGMNKISTPFTLYILLFYLMTIDGYSS